MMTRCCACLLLLVSGSTSCKADDDPAKRLHHTFIADVDAKRAYIDIDVNGRPALHLPPLDERLPEEYVSMDEKIELTPWIEDGDNIVTFHITPNDGSGLQYTELTIRHVTFPDGARTRLFHSEHEKSGSVEAQFALAPPGAPSCDREVSPADREEITEAVQALRGAVERRDIDALKASIEGEGPFLTAAEWFLENSWDATRGGEALVSEITVEDLRIVRSCANQAIYVTNARGGEIFRYRFTSPSGRTSVQSRIESIVLRKLDGAWKQIH